MPMVRFRLNAENGQSDAVLQLNSDASGTAIPSILETQDYTVIFDPPRSAIGDVADKDGVSVGFDLMHSDENDSGNAMVYMNDFNLEQLDKFEFDKGFASQKVYDFLSGAEGWQFFTGFNGLTSATGYWDSITKTLTLQAPEYTGFGFWTIDSNVDIDPNTVYRITFDISSSSATESSRVPMFRLRVSDGITFNQVINVNSAGNGEILPLKAQQPYEVYYQPPADVAATGRTLVLGFDITHFDPNDYTSIILRLHNVTIDSRPLN
jgi:hypothetical protein